MTNVMTTANDDPTVTGSPYRPRRHRREPNPGLPETPYNGIDDDCDDATADDDPTVTGSPWPTTATTPTRTGTPACRRRPTTASMTTAMTAADDDLDGDGFAWPTTATTPTNRILVAETPTTASTT